jgi:hypothetical protein
LLATVLAYLPTFSAGFVRWDDQYYVEESNLLPDPDGLTKIWNPFGHDTQQFYPLVFSSYWLEYRIWGLDPRSYHVVNVGLHAINALLVLSVVLEFGVSTPVAAASAASARSCAARTLPGRSARGDVNTAASTRWPISRNARRSGGVCERTTGAVTSA